MFQITYKKTNSVTVTLSFNVLHMARWQSHRSRHNAITDNSLWICFILSFSWTMNLRAILCYNVSSLETAWHSISKSNIRLMALSWTQVNTKSWNQALQTIDHTVVLALLTLSIKAVLKNKTISSYSSSMHKAFLIKMRKKIPFPKGWVSKTRKCCHTRMRQRLCQWINA